MNSTILISSTNTEVGKTQVITALTAYLLKHRDQKELVGLIKLIQTGQGDLEYYLELFDAQFKEKRLQIEAPLVFEKPIATPLAAEYEGKEIDLGYLWQQFSALSSSSDFVLAEGSGGLGSPITRELTFADLAASWRIPTILVAPVELGVIAQIVANVALARQKGVNLLGIVLNCTCQLDEEQIADWAPVDLIFGLTQVPILGYFPYLENPQDLDALCVAASGLDLEVIFN
jgi:dethiobiotin synthetase